MADADNLFALRRYRNTPAGFAIAAGIVLLALGLRFAVDGLVTIPFVTLFPAIIASALLGGRWAGIAVAAFGGLVSWYFWLGPTRGFSLQWPSGWFNAFFYVLTSAVLLYLVRRFNETLDALARERDRSADLFSELQHRTANNLQSAAAMLDHGIRRVKAEPAAAIEILEAAQRRFAMMGSIHRRLYDGKIFEYQATEQLQAVCGDVMEAMNVEHIDVSVGGDRRMILKQDQMLALSLLVVELVLNAIKHAFADCERGRISIDLAQDGERCIMIYEDDGAGLKPQSSGVSASRLGNRIMRGLAAQLGGAVEPRASVRGYSCAVKFPVLTNSRGRVETASATVLDPI